MDRLHTEFERLYRPHPEGRAQPHTAAEAAPCAAVTGAPASAAGTAAQPADHAGLVDAHGWVRAMVLELARPADWAVLSRVWKGVQTDLDWPAPAIAVSGVDGLQLWFALAEPVPAARVVAVLDALCACYLSDVPARRLVLRPAADPQVAGGFSHAAPVPAPQRSGGPWSAFVAPDLAAVFADEPWLDLPPNPEGQARLLAGLAVTPLDDLYRALASTAPATPSPSPPAGTGQGAPGAPGAPDVSVVQVAPVGPTSPAAPVASDERDAHAGLDSATDPRQFLLAVMRDGGVPLALRIDAAKALLAYPDPDPEP